MPKEYQENGVGAEPAKNRVTFENKTAPASLIHMTFCAWRTMYYFPESLVKVSLRSLGLSSMIGYGIVEFFFPSWLKPVRYGVGTLASLISAMLAITTYKFFHHRLPADKIAVEDFTKRINTSRAKRTLQYEIFFPQISAGGKVKRGLVFYPGMLVDHLSYAKILGELSDQGVLVVLVHAEPTRMASPYEGCTLGQLLNILKDVDVMLKIHVEEWALGGHSFGAWCASKLIQQTTTHNIQRLVQWGSRYTDDISRFENIQVLVVNGTQDGVNQGLLPDNKLFLKHFPKSVTEHLIEGGNHAGFGHYGPQEFPCPDKERTIGLDKQHSVAIEHTVDFLNS